MEHEWNNLWEGNDFDVKSFFYRHSNTSQKTRRKRDAVLIRFIMQNLVDR